MTDPIEAMGDAFCDVFRCGNAPTMADMPNPALYREALTAAYQALRNTLVPVGWLVVHPKHFTEFSQQRLMLADKADGWTETPLFSLPEVKP